jgi:hypothetical protein
VSAIVTAVRAPSGSPSAASSTASVSEVRSSIGASAGSSVSVMSGEATTASRAHSGISFSRAYPEVSHLPNCEAKRSAMSLRYACRSIRPLIDTDETCSAWMPR